MRPVRLDRMGFSKRVAGLFSAALLTGGCALNDADLGGGLESGALQAAEGGTEPDTATPMGGCSMKPLDCKSGDRWRELLRASSVGEGVRFRAFDAATVQLTILAEEPDGNAMRPVVVRQLIGKQPIVARLKTPLDRVMIPVSIVALTEPLAGKRVIAMLCDGPNCQLQGTDAPDVPGDTSLTPLPGGTPPAWVRPTFAVAARVSMGGQTKAGVCVGGDGMACWDGAEWVTRIEPGSGALLRAASARNSEMLAVGDGGRLVTVGGNGKVESRPVEVDLTSVSAFEGGYVAAGAQGTIVSSSIWSTCSMSVGPDALTSIGADRMQGFTAASPRRIISGSIPDRSWCAEPPPFVEAIRSVMVFACGQSDNSLLLTEDGVYGVFECSCQLC